MISVDSLPLDPSFPEASAREEESASLASPAARALLSCFPAATSRTASTNAAPLDTRKRQAAPLFPLLTPLHLPSLAAAVSVCAS